MNVRVIVRDDGAHASAPPIHDAHHDTAIEPRPGYVLTIVEIPGYRAPVVEQCEIVKVGAGTGLVCRCRAGRVVVEWERAEVKRGIACGDKRGMTVSATCKACGTRASRFVADDEEPREPLRCPTCEVVS